MLRFSIAATLCLFAHAAFAQEKSGFVDITDVNRMANVLESTMGDVKLVTECSFRIEVDVNCIRESTKKSTCTATGIKHDGTAEIVTRSFDGVNLIASLKASGITFKKELGVRGLRCTVIKAGFAGCSDGLKKDDILCAAESVSKR